MYLYMGDIAKYVKLYPKHSLPFRVGGWSRNPVWGTASPQSPTAPACFGERVPVRCPGSRVHSGTSPDGQGREPWRTGQQNLLYLATSRKRKLSGVMTHVDTSMPAGSDSKRRSLWAAS